MLLLNGVWVDGWWNVHRLAVITSDLVAYTKRLYFLAASTGVAFNSVDSNDLQRR